jgi:DNA repair exonuclease SbcCD ATPase subunit
VTRAKTKKRLVEGLLDEQRKLLNEDEKKLKAAKEAKEIMAEVSKLLHVEVQHKLTHIVNRLMTIVFDDPYKLVITFESRANRQEAYLLLERDGEQIDPLSSVSGGVIDVAAFGLRLAVILMRGGSKTLVFDEPFRFVSQDRREILAEVLEQLTTKYGVQIIMVTHHPEFELGKVVEL